MSPFALLLLCCVVLCCVLCYILCCAQLVGKAKAAARAAAKAKTAPKSSGVKSAWKFFKDVVAIEMHPGYSEEVVTKVNTKERGT